MNSDRSAAGPSHAADQRAATSPRACREVSLKFWVGPFRLWTTRLFLAVEEWRADPFGPSMVAEPNLEALPANVAGIYRPSAPLDRDVPTLTISRSAIRYVEGTFNRRFIDLSTGYEAYLGKFSTKTRSTMKRKLRKFADVSGGQIDWRDYHTRDEMLAFHAIARQISKLTYQEKLFDVGLPDDANFLAHMQALAQDGLVRGFILFLGGKPISYLYLPIKDGRVIYGHLGFDPSYSGHSPGTVLQLLALERVFDERAYRIFDFTEGEGEHKRLFSTHERYCGNVFYLRSTVRNRAVIRLHFAIRELSTFLDRLLARTNLKTRLKQLLRGQRRLN